MFYETVFKKEGRVLREYAKAENVRQVITYFYDKEKEAELLSIQKKEVIRGIPEGFYVNIPAGYKPTEDIEGTVIEVTWLYRELWDRGFIQDIPYQELTELIEDVAEKFENIHK